MPDPTAWIILLGTALAGSVIGGVAGFGAGVVLLPVVAWTVGLRAAVPIMTVTMLVGNLSRLWWSRGEIDRAVAVRFLAGALPATAVGAILYAGTPSTALSLVIGVFLLASVPLRRFLASPVVQIRLRHFPVVGAVFGFLSSLVVTTGPVVTPFFLAYGLRRGAYIATEAACAFAMHGVRGAVLARYALLTWETIAIGCALGGTMFAGSWLGRRLLDRMSDRVFLRVIEALLIVMGLHFVLFPR
ncbi:MAG: sulfite exporter TauE/SafE family protein [Candidatus Rokubacteria bacterium]|nr:sulfite exporter TauE/SafE family protein [Candidatus Rokubacteria bacterium]